MNYKSGSPILKLLSLVAFFTIATCGFSQIVRYQNTIRGGFGYATNTLRNSSGFVKTDGGTKMSSSSDLVLPAGSTIVKAFLYVENYGGPVKNFQFKVPGGAYKLINNTTPGFIADQLASPYGLMVVDVTSMISPTGYTSNYVVGGDPGGAGKYSICDLPVYSNNNGYGWCLYAIYVNPNSKYRHITIADACTVMNYPATVAFDIPGVLVPATGTVNAVVGMTGCYGEETGITPLLDNLGIGTSTGLPTQMADPTTGSTTDVYNGTIGLAPGNCVSADGGPAMSGPYRAKNPQGAHPTNCYWYDSDIFAASGVLPNSPTPITVRVTSTAVFGDVFSIGAFAVAVEIQTALLEKSISPNKIPAGGTATYSFNISNIKTGGRDQDSICFTDSIPAGLQICGPNGVTVTGGSNAVVTAVPGSNILKVSGLDLKFGETCVITVNVTNKKGKSNPTCDSNPLEFTNEFKSINGLTTNCVNGITPQCLIVLEAPKAGFKADSVCLGNSTSFTDTSKAATGAPLSNWDWDFGDGQTSTTQNPQHTYAAAGNYNVTLKVTDIFGSKDSVVKVVKVKALPIVTTVAPSAICKGDSAQLNVSGGNKYKWTPSAGLSKDNIAKPKASPGSTSTYKVKITDTLTGCFVDTNQIVTVNALPTITISGDLSVCPGGYATTLTAKGAVSYNWMPGGMPDSVVSVAPSIETTYTITGTDSKGCKNKTTAKVLMAPAPADIQPTITERACVVADGKIEVTTVDQGTAPFEYAINGGAWQGSNTFTGLDSLTYQISVRDAKGCILDKAFPIGVVAGPNNMNITTTPSGCSAPIGAITVVSTDGGESPYQYSRDNVLYQPTGVFSGLGSGSYLIYVKDNNGCVYNTTAIVSPLNGPNDIVATLVADSCGRTTGSITITSIKGGKAPYEYSNDGVNFSSNMVYTGLAGGTYSIYTRDAGGCMYSKAFKIQSLAPITNYNAVATADSCALNKGTIKVTFEVGGTAPFKYSLDGVNFQSSNLFTGLTNNNYTVEVRDKNLCSLTKPVVVVLLPAITAVTPTITDATCTQSNGQVSLSPTGGTAPFSFKMDSDPYSTSTSFSGLSIGNHNIQTQDANGCKFPLSITIKDNPGPSSIKSSQTTTSCAGPTGTFTVDSITNGTKPFLFSLKGAAYVPDTTFINLGAGDYSLIIKDANGCTLTVNFTIVTASNPTAINLNRVHTTCSQLNGSVDFVGGTGGTPPYEFSFNGGSYSATVTHYGNLDDGTYPVVMRDSKQCTIPQNANLVDFPSPTGVQITRKPTFCNQNVGQLVMGPVNGGTAPYTYSVNSAPFDTARTWKNYAPGIYTIVVKDKNGCTYPTTDTIKDIAGPSGLQSVATADTCQKNTGSIRVSQTSGPAKPFTYSINGTNFQPARFFTQVPPGTYTVTVKDTNGCTTTGTKTVGIVNGPDSAKVVKLTRPHCALPDGTIQVDVSSITGGTPPYSISISGTVDPQDGIFAPLDARTYYLNISDKHQCLKVQQIDLIDISGPTAATPEVKNSTCSKDNGSVKITNIQDGTAPFSYASYDEIYGSSNTFGGLKSAEQYQFFVRDAAGCILQVWADVFDEAGPSDINADIVHENCYRGDGALNNFNATNGTAPISFVVNGFGPFDAGESVANLGHGNYTVVATDKNGCELRRQMNIFNNPAPIADFTPSENEGEAPIQISFFNHSTPDCTYDWAFGDGGVDDEYHSLHTYQDSGDFDIELTVTNPAGCISKTNRLIHLKPGVGIYVPTTFTPNGDGANDYFNAVTKNIQSYVLTIFNRWGEVITVITQDDPGWDGRFKGDMCKGDIYPYSLEAIDYESKKHKSTGTVTLMQ